MRAVIGGIRLAVCLLAFGAAVPAHAIEVHFGGFAFAGEAQDIDRSYPYTSAIANSSGAQSPLDKALYEKLGNFSNPAFDLEFGFGTIEPGSSAIALGLMLDRETVSIEKIGGQHKLLVVLSAQALFFDFKEKALLASYPLSVQYIHVTDGVPGRDEIAKVVRELYLGNVGVNVLDDFVAVTTAASLNPAVSRRIQVAEVNIGSEALPHLPEVLATNLAALKSSIAQDFSKYLSLNQKIPVLPYTAGYAIGNRLATRFSNGDVFDLVIPEADYTIGLSLEKLKRIEYDTSSAGSSYVYGAFLNVKAMEPLSQKIYIDATFKNGATKLVPASQETVDDWPAFQESLLALMDKLTLAVSDPSGSWASKHAGSRSVARDLEKLQKVLESCK